MPSELISATLLAFFCEKLKGLGEGPQRCQGLPQRSANVYDVLDAFRDQMGADGATGMVAAPPLGHPIRSKWSGLSTGQQNANKILGCMQSWQVFFE